jgi:hypothetical protein
MGFEQDSANPMNSARRKLLRGSVSVPTIMTLSSGAAMANGSTIRCFNNATWLPDPNTYSVRGVQRYTKTISGVVYYYIGPGVARQQRRVRDRIVLHQPLGDLGLHQDRRRRLHRHTDAGIRQVRRSAVRLQPRRDDRAALQGHRHVHDGLEQPQWRQRERDVRQLLDIVRGDQVIRFAGADAG